MIQKYNFLGDGDIEFDDSKSVKELIAYAFETFDYYEPLGMEIVTIFQAHHSKSHKGWFTTDTSLSCAEEIENCDDLFFAYHMPGVFYFAEGGWGHHMRTLGNHPYIDSPVSLKLSFEDFKNTVVINGEYCFADVLRYLKSGGYVPNTVSFLKICAINPYMPPYTISLSDPIISAKLTEFSESLPDAVTIIEVL